MWRNYFVFFLPRSKKKKEMATPTHKTAHLHTRTACPDFFREADAQTIPKAFGSKRAAILLTHPC